MIINCHSETSLCFFFLYRSLFVSASSRFLFFFIILVSSVSVGEGPLYCKVFADNVFAETFSDRSTESLGWKFYENRVKFDLLDIF